MQFIASLLIRWLRQLLISTIFRRDAIYCVLTNWTIQLFFYPFAGASLQLVP